MAEAKPCEQCGEPMKPRRFPCGVREGPKRFSQRRFCSRVCSVQAKYPRGGGPAPVQYPLKCCEGCGVVLPRESRTGRRRRPAEYGHLRFCDPCRYGRVSAARSATGNGWHKDRKGYMVKSEAGQTLRQHRVAMTEHIGRDLLPHETVHHINGDRTDNRLSNLELWSSSHPSGQRVADKLAWAREILATYEYLPLFDTIPTPSKRNGK